MPRLTDITPALTQFAADVARERELTFRIGAQLAQMRQRQYEFAQGHALDRERIAEQTRQFELTNQRMLNADAEAAKNQQATRAIAEGHLRRLTVNDTFDQQKALATSGLKKVIDPNYEKQQRETQQQETEFFSAIANNPYLAFEPGVLDQIERFNQIKSMPPSYKLELREGIMPPGFSETDSVSLQGMLDAGGKWAQEAQNEQEAFAAAGYAEAAKSITWSLGWRNDRPVLTKDRGTASLLLQAGKAEDAAYVVALGRQSQHYQSALQKFTALIKTGEVTSIDQAEYLAERSTERAAAKGLFGARIKKEQLEADAAEAQEQYQAREELVVPAPGAAAPPARSTVTIDGKVYTVPPGGPVLFSPELYGPMVRPGHEVLAESFRELGVPETGLPETIERLRALEESAGIVTVPPTVPVPEVVEQRPGVPVTEVGQPTARQAPVVVEGIGAEAARIGRSVTELIRERRGQTPLAEAPLQTQPITAVERPKPPAKKYRARPIPPGVAVGAHFRLPLANTNEDISALLQQGPETLVPGDFIENESGVRFRVERPGVKEARRLVTRQYGEGWFMYP